MLFKIQCHIEIVNHKVLNFLMRILCNKNLENTKAFTIRNTGG